MTPMQPLITLLAQSESERDSVQAELTRVSALHQSALAQTEQLVNYRRDYETRWTQQFQTASTMTLVQCYRGFIQRLTLAIEQQQQVTKQAAQEVGQVRSALVAQELRVATVRKLIERRVAEDQVELARKDQKTSDEFAARSAWNGSQADTPSMV
jgi:flagellar protein FliJ